MKLDKFNHYLFITSGLLKAISHTPLLLIENIKCAKLRQFKSLLNQNKSLDEIKFYLNQQSFNSINKQYHLLDKSNNNLLSEAISYHRFDVAQYLLEKNVSPIIDTITLTKIIQPYYTKSEEQRLMLVSLLLEKGLNVNYSEFNPVSKQTISYLNNIINANIFGLASVNASESDMNFFSLNEKMLTLFINHGAQVQDKEGILLIDAIRSHHIPFIDLILTISNVNNDYIQKSFKIENEPLEKLQQTALNYLKAKFEQQQLNKTISQELNTKKRQKI
jgi:hypothetical protein